MQDNPAMYWPLSDEPPTGVPVVAGQSTWASNAKATYQVNTVPAPTPPVFGVTGGPGLDNINCVQFPDATNGGGQLSWTTPRGWGITDTGPGVSYEVWFKTSMTTQAQCFAEYYNANNGGITMSLHATGLMFVQHFTAGVVDQTINDILATNDGNWHYACLTELASGGTVTGTLQVDNRTVGTWSRAGTAAEPVFSVGVGQSYWLTVLASGLTGYAARAAVYRTALSAARRTSHYVSSLGFPWDTGGQRIARILAWMPWAGPTNIDNGVTRVSPAVGYDGKSVLTAIQDATAAENSSFFMSPAGVPTFFHRDRYYVQQTSVWTLGESENPYQDDVQASTDITYLYNLVSITGYTDNPQTVTNATSVDMYLPRTLPKTLAIRTDPDALQLAWHLQNNYQQPRPRLATITLSPADNPALWPIALGAKFGDRITFVRRASGGGVTVTFDGFIDRIERSEAVGAWKVLLQISPVDAIPAGIVGDATYGIVGTTAHIKF